MTEPPPITVEAFLQDVAIQPAGSLADVLDELGDFLMTAAAQARGFRIRTRKADGPGIDSSNSEPMHLCALVPVTRIEADATQRS